MPNDLQPQLNEEPIAGGTFTGSINQEAFNKTTNKKLEEQGELIRSVWIIAVLTGLGVAISFVTLLVDVFAFKLTTRQFIIDQKEMAEEGMYPEEASLPEKSALSDKDLYKTIKIFDEMK